VTTNKLFKYPAVFGNFVSSVSEISLKQKMSQRYKVVVFLAEIIKAVVILNVSKGLVKREIP